MDLYSRKILAWKVSNTPDAEFCVRALDNIYVERFWRSLKYEDIYLRDYRRKNHAI